MAIVDCQFEMKLDCVWKIITEYLGMWKVSRKMQPRLLNADQKGKIIIEYLVMWKVSRKMQPRLLNVDQKGHRLWMCQVNIKSLQIELVLPRIVITGKRNVDCFSMTRKPNSRSVSGRFRCRWGWRKQDYPGQKSKTCWSCYSMCNSLFSSKGLCS